MIIRYIRPTKAVVYTDRASAHADANSTIKGDSSGDGAAFSGYKYKYGEFDPWGKQSYFSCPYM